MAIEIVRSILPPPHEKPRHHNQQEETDVEQIVDYLTGASPIAPDLKAFTYPHNPGFDPPEYTEIFSEETHFHTYHPKPVEKTPAPVPVQKKMPASPLRRTLIRTGLAAGIVAATNIDTLATQAAYLSQEARLYAYFLADPNIRAIATASENQEIQRLKNPSFYDTSSFTNTRIVALGDSIARGENDTGADIAPAQIVVDRMNTFFQSPEAWRWQNEAWNGATTEKVLIQLEKVRESAWAESTDLVLSVGGNDTLAFVERPETITKINDLIANPKNPQLVQSFAHGVASFLSTYEKDFTKVMNQIKEIAQLPKSTIKRLYLYGVPPMGNAQGIVLPNGISFPMEGDIRYLATQVSILLNNTMAKVADQYVDDAPFDIVFVDTSSLTRDKFSDMHPNTMGYELIAHEQMKKGLTRLPNGEIRSHYDLTT